MTHRFLSLALCVTLVASSAPMSASAAKPAPAARPAAALKLQKIDTKPGSGKLAMNGSMVSIHYTGWLYAPKSSTLRGAKFDSSNNAKPFTFKLGAGAVIKGWDEGIKGMKVGGRRTLLVPAALAFGKEGLGAVPPGANLIFEVELVDVK
jgi:FKBP-type peptidyl-prolyl cis-trans isomerase FkpA